MIKQLLGLMLFVVWSSQTVAQTDACSRISAMTIYSNAKIYSDAFPVGHKEMGHLLGYELAVNPPGSTGAFLYVYEDEANKEGIPLHGQVSGNRINLRGEWVVHVTEMPSRKEYVETRHVAVEGVLDLASFKGRIRIESKGRKNIEPVTDSVRLKQVKRLWFCGN